MCHSVLSTFICCCLQFLHAFLECAAETRCPVLWRQCRSVATANSAVQPGRRCTVLTDLSYALVKGTLFHGGDEHRKANLSFFGAITGNLKASLFHLQVFFVLVSPNDKSHESVCSGPILCDVVFLKTPCHLPKYFHRPHSEWVVFTDSELTVVVFFFSLLTCKHF